MEGSQPGRGAANLAAAWKTLAAEQGGPLIRLSGGDNWTGPAVSTWFQGESMVEVMNAVGYDASALGNHEFDFGLETLKKRAAQARFPYLAANLSRKSDGAFPVELGIKPYILLRQSGLKIAIIGLADPTTPSTTNPQTVSTLNFGDPEAALRKYVPMARSEGADMLLVPAHLCLAQASALAVKVGDLHIDLLGAGHCNEKIALKIGGTVILEGGSYMDDYAYASFEIDPARRSASSQELGTRPAQAPAPLPEVAAIVARWKAQADAQLSQPIGYLQQEIPRRSSTMQALVVGSWLAGYPQADAAITNLGGFRDRLPPGMLTNAAIISVMPFDNTLVDVRLTGVQLLEVLNYSGQNAAVGGLVRTSSGWIVSKTGRGLEPGSDYHVLVNDFMYAGGDGYEMLVKADPYAYNTGIQWRQPLIDWIKAQNSSPDHPLDPAIAVLARH
jgi:2',3'-cyclic-nucleotide 2'-phosphodiesterase (5'-nucleotidase family)